MKQKYIVKTLAFTFSASGVAAGVGYLGSGLTVAGIAGAACACWCIIYFASAYLRLRRRSRIVRIDN